MAQRDNRILPAACVLKRTQVVAVAITLDRVDLLRVHGRVIRSIVPRREVEEGGPDEFWADRTTDNRETFTELITSMGGEPQSPGARDASGSCCWRCRRFCWPCKSPADRADRS